MSEELCPDCHTPVRTDDDIVCSARHLPLTPYTEPISYATEVLYDGDIAWKVSMPEAALPAWRRLVCDAKAWREASK